MKVTILFEYEKDLEGVDTSIMLQQSGVLSQEELADFYARAATASFGYPIQVGVVSEGSSDEDINWSSS